MVSRLLDHIRQQHYNTLITACIEGDIDEVISLLASPHYKSSETINQKIQGGLTALIISVFKSRSDIVKEVLNHTQIDVEAETTNHWRAIHFAAQSEDNVDIVHLLLQKGASVHIKSPSGYPIHISSKNNILVLVKLFIYYGANIFVEDYEGNFCWNLTTDTALRGFFENEILRFSKSITLRQYEMIIINLRKIRKKSQGSLNQPSDLCRSQIDLLSSASVPRDILENQDEFLSWANTELGAEVSDSARDAPASLVKSCLMSLNPISVTKDLELSGIILPNSAFNDICKISKCAKVVSVTNCWLDSHHMIEILKSTLESPVVEYIDISDNIPSFEFLEFLENRFRSNIPTSLKTLKFNSQKVVEHDLNVSLGEAEEFVSSFLNTLSSSTNHSESIIDISRQNQQYQHSEGSEQCLFNFAEQLKMIRSDHQHHSTSFSNTRKTDDTDNDMDCCLPCIRNKKFSILIFFPFLSFGKDKNRLETSSKAKYDLIISIFRIHLKEVSRLMNWKTFQILSLYKTATCSNNHDIDFMSYPLFHLTFSIGEADVNKSILDDFWIFHEKFWLSQHASSSMNPLNQQSCISRFEILSDLPHDITFMRKFPRILILDGGGMRGLISLKILRELENELHLQSYHDAQLSDAFDWIVGTSTGGIIALALRSGKSLETISSLYLAMSSTIFRKPIDKIKNTFRQGKKRNLGLGLSILVGGLIASPQIALIATVGATIGYFGNETINYLKNVWSGGFYDHKTLESILSQYLGNDKKLHELPGNTVVTTFNMKNNTSIFLNSMDQRYGKIKVCTAARMTSAAPLYFVPVKFNFNGQEVEEEEEEEKKEKEDTIVDDTSYMDTSIISTTTTTTDNEFALCADGGITRNNPCYDFIREYKVSNNNNDDDDDDDDDDGNSDRSVVSPPIVVSIGTGLYCSSRRSRKEEENNNNNSKKRGKMKKDNEKENFFQKLLKTVIQTMTETEQCHVKAIEEINDRKKWKYYRLQPNTLDSNYNIDCSDSDELKSLQATDITNCDRSLMRNIKEKGEVFSAKQIVKDLLFPNFKE